jgi:hypothetical protein
MFRIKTLEQHHSRRPVRNEILKISSRAVSKQNEIRKCHKCFCVQTVLFLNENSNVNDVQESVTKTIEGLKIGCICEVYLKISTKNPKWKEIWQVNKKKF